MEMLPLTSSSFNICLWGETFGSRTILSMLNTTGTVVFAPLHETVYLGLMLFAEMLWQRHDGGDISWFTNENWTKNK